MSLDTPSLDPCDWSDVRVLGHKMMDDMLDHLIGLRDMPVWQAMPADVRASFQSAMPRTPTDVSVVYETFRETIQPYGSGNTHPRFMGWVLGGGNVISMLAEMLAGAINVNCSGRDHVGVALERQVISWAAEMLGMPAESTGLLLTGTSIATFVAVLCARTRALGREVRVEGVGGARLTAYASAGIHRCIPGALDMAGLGRDSLRKIPVDSNYEMDLCALRQAIARDRAAGYQPFLLVGTAGSVDVGAVDDLDSLRKIAAEEKLWFHVDAAFGAWTALSPTLKPRLLGVEHADSIAFDFHKWAQVTYEAGCVLVRDPAIQLATFAQSTPYLANAPRGLSTGDTWPCDTGPDLSRGFRALKVWMTLKAYGTDKLGEIVDHTCGLAKHLEHLVNNSPVLELAAPVALNIVCFRVRHATDEATQSLVADLQEEGLFAPSTTVIQGRLVIRAAIVNHRTTREDIDDLVSEIIYRAGRVERREEAASV